MYKGYNWLLFFGIPKWFVRYYTYSYVRRNILNGDSKIHDFLTGFIAGFVDGTLVVTPM